MSNFKQIDIDGTNILCKDETARRGVTSSYAGLCPQLPADNTKYLRGDGQWGNPSGTTYSVVNKTADGLCPQLPNETTTTKYLRQDGTWVVPPNTTYSVVSKTANGLCPQLPNETTTTKYLRQDGTWVVPPNDNTTTGTTYTAGNVPANTTFGTNGSIKNVYDSLLASNIASITRSGTTFTAKNSAGTQLFTFTQQDNNTTTGTTYTAGNVPANTTFGTNGSIKNCFDALVGENITPNYGDSAVSSGNVSPTSSSPYTFTATKNCMIFISAWRTAAGYTLTAQVNGITVFQIPANSAGMFGLSLPLLKGQTLKLITDTTSASYTVNVRGFNKNS